MINWGIGWNKVWKKDYTQSCCIYEDYDGHSSNIQIERDYSCDVLFCVCMWATAEHSNGL